MANYISVDKTVGDVSFRVALWAMHSSANGLGCQATIYGGLGNFVVSGIGLLSPNGVVTNVVGQPPAPPGTTSSSFGMHYDHKVDVANLPKPITSQMVVDAAWEAITRSFTGGIILFSDRVNRGTAISPSKPTALYGNQFLSVASYAKWLSSRPDLGTLFAGPIFHNPNHSMERDFSLCQVFQFVKGKRLYVEDTGVGIPPDYPLGSKEKFVELLGKNTTVGANIKTTYI